MSVTRGTHGAFTLKRELAAPRSGLTSALGRTSIQIVQTIFSMFLAGASGVALLLLRRSIAATLFIDPTERVSLSRSIRGALQIHASIGTVHGLRRR